MSDPQRPPSITELANRVVDRQRGRRRTDDLSDVERIARIGSWRQIPLTVGLAVAILAGAWRIWGLRDELESRIRYEISVHDHATGAHGVQIGDVRGAWLKCLEMSQRVLALEAKIEELSRERPESRKRR